MYEQLYWVSSETQLFQDSKVCFQMWKMATKTGCRQNQSVEDAWGILPAHCQTWACNLVNWLTLILFCQVKVVAGLAESGCRPLHLRLPSLSQMPHKGPNFGKAGWNERLDVRWRLARRLWYLGISPSKKELAGLLTYVLWSYLEKQNKFFHLWL